VPSKIAIASHNMVFLSRTNAPATSGPGQSPEGRALGAYPLRFLASAASTAGSLHRTIIMRLFVVDAKPPPWPTWA
jgi:hypothetical protein